LFSAEEHQSTYLPVLQNRALDQSTVSILLG
jgi:hypothetical protein